MNNRNERRWQPWGGKREAEEAHAEEVARRHPYLFIPHETRFLLFFSPTLSPSSSPPPSSQVAPDEHLRRPPPLSSEQDQARCDYGRHRRRKVPSLYRLVHPFPSFSDYKLRQNAALQRVGYNDEQNPSAREERGSPLPAGGLR
ncbi:hypothetical protein V6N11_027306 [Hibiscus sabdariffa]|uniref:Uncharacterized protein n=1 Tax=Hibiscus sabdariffa TaxID=183260 RepID=A0ABR2PGI2_9ROSI